MRRCSWLASSSSGRLYGQRMQAASKTLCSWAVNKRMRREVEMVRAALEPAVARHKFRRHERNALRQQPFGSRNVYKRAVWAPTAQAIGEVVRSACPRHVGKLLQPWGDLITKRLTEMFEGEGERPNKKGTKGAHGSAPSATKGGEAPHAPQRDWVEHALKRSLATFGEIVDERFTQAKRRIEKVEKDQAELSHLKERLEKLEIESRDKVASQKVFEEARAAVEASAREAVAEAKQAREQASPPGLGGAPAAPSGRIQDDAWMHMCAAVVKSGMGSAVELYFGRESALEKATQAVRAARISYSGGARVAGCQEKP